MKKILSLFIAVVMILSMSVATFAASDDFFGSPSKKPAPELVDSEHEDPNCTGELIIVSYGDRDDLTDDQKDKFEDAYDSIVDAEDLSDLNNKLTDDDLAVGDLFGIKLTEDEDHGNHGNTNVSLKIDNADSFDSLIAFDGEKWVVVDASLNGDVLNFSYKLGDFSVFAIVVNTGDAPQTGDTFSWVYVALMVASATGFVAVCISMRKKKD